MMVAEPARSSPSVAADGRSGGTRTWSPTTAARTRVTADGVDAAAPGSGRGAEAGGAAAPAPPDEREAQQQRAGAEPRGAAPGVTASPRAAARRGSAGPSRRECP